MDRGKPAAKLPAAHLSMQFSHESNLQTMIRFLRSGVMDEDGSEDGASESTGFFLADKHLNRMYSSSPPLNLIAEHKSSLSRTKSNALKSPSSRRKPKKTNVSVELSNDTVAGMNLAAAQNTESKAVKDNVKKLSSDRQSNETASSKKGADKTPLDSSFNGKLKFKRVDVSQTVPAQSGLSKLFAGKAAEADRSMLRVLVYLPDRSSIKIRLKENGTVDDAIKLVLSRQRESGNEPHLAGSSSSYELRLHDEDGEPEDDFPALERSREVKHFDTDGVHEYCLCVIEGKEPTSDKNAEEGVDNTADGRLLRINMPNGLHTTIDKHAILSLRDLIPVLARKYRLPLYYETVQFEVSEEDQEKLHMMSNVLELSTQIDNLNVNTIELTTKKYADSPAYGLQELNGYSSLKRMHSAESNASGGTGRTKARGQSGKGNKGLKRPPESAFLYNEVTAAIYKEWTIVKTNRWGRRQKRIIGVDLSKIYNKKISDGSKQRRGSVSGVRRAERLITDVKSIEYVEGVPTNFKITHAEGDGQQVLEYEAETPHECVEIVVKIKTILNLMHKRTDTL